MTDMEAKAKWDKALDYAVESIWNGGSRDRIREILMQVKGEAHREGMEEGRKSVKLECDEARKWGMEEGIKQRQEAEEFQGQAIRNATLEEAVKLVCKDCADGTKHNWIGCPAAAIREKINE